MADDEITLSCILIDDAPDKALIQTDVGEAWVYRSDFSMVLVQFERGSSQAS
jgi:hypothetical protein